MKIYVKSILFLLVILFSCKTNKNDETSSVPIKGMVRSLFFLDSNHGYAVGSEGLAIKTINAGITWERMSIDTYSLFSVYFTDIDNGYLVDLMPNGAGEGYIHKTTDGGKTWSYQFFGVPLSSVFFLNSNTGFAVGNALTILRTPDAGINWDLTFHKDTNSFLYSIHFPNDSIGYAVGTNNIILKTTDKGNTWQTQKPGVQNTYFNSVFFTSVDTGYVVGTPGRIIRTINGGQSWSTQFSSPPDNCNSVFFVNTKVGYCVGYGANGLILKTTDYGEHWIDLSMNIQVPDGLSLSFKTCYFTDSTTGYIAGDIMDQAHSISPVIYKTADGGMTWKKQL
jgi:photosystem II stability/assembly factor-like uncharacterized protein